MRVGGGVGGVWESGGGKMETTVLEQQFKKTTHVVPANSGCLTGCRQGRPVHKT